MKTRKKIPHHAYSFSASLLLAAVAVINEWISDSPQSNRFPIISASLLFALHGLYDLKKEHRLRKVTAPITNTLHHLFQPNLKEQNPAECQVSRSENRNHFI